MAPNPINYGHRARIGVLLPSGNMAAEPELSYLMPAGVSCHITRLPLSGSDRDQLLGMTTQVESAALLLKDARPNVMVFHCTAVSTWDVEMDQRICARIHTVAAVPATTTAAALIHSLRVFEARNIVLITPYIEEINQREVHFLRHHGVEVLAARGLGLRSPEEMLAEPPRTWFDLALKHRHPDADAYLISCTAIRSLEIIEDLENVLGRPVLTSNQAMAWHAMRLCGIDDPVLGVGMLLRT